jgi:hypothetical protein
LWYNSLHHSAFSDLHSVIGGIPAMKDTPTKEIITRAAVEQQLHKQNQTEIRSLSILFFILCVLCLLMAALMNSASAQLGHWLLLRIVLTAVPLLPMIFAANALLCVICERSLLKRGAFDIIPSSLYCKDEKYRRRRAVRYLYFESYRGCPVGNTAYALASPGDPYYIVVYRMKRPRVKLFYAGKQYEYRE